MSKNKLAKLLLSLGIGVATVTTGIASACNTGGGSDGGDEHSHSYGEWISDGESGHHHDCVDGDDTQSEGHNYGNDNVCDDCGYNKTVSVEGVTLDKSTATVLVGGTLTLNATVTPADATNKAVSWTSSKPAVATVVDGVVTGVKKGTTKITVTTADGSKTATCTVTVEIPDHEHVYDENSWAYDSVNHYHPCTVYEGCTVYENGEPHVLDLDTMKCEVCGLEYQNMTYELVPDELETQTYSENYNVGIYTIIGGTTIRNRARLNYDVYGQEGANASEAEKVETGFSANKSIQYNGTNVGFGINAPAAGTLYLYLDNGSSGLEEGQFQTFVFTKADGSTETISYPAKLLRRVEIEIEEAGYYTITRGSGGTTDIYYAKFDTIVPVTPIEEMGIVDPGTNEYLVGQDLDLSKLQIQLVHAQTGSIDPVSYNDSHITIDTSAYNKNVPGTYTIEVTYTDDDGNDFTDSYDVTVYAVEALELGFNKIVTGNSGYNGTYENVAVRQFYFVNESVQLDGLTVYAVYKNGASKMMVSSGYTTNVGSVAMNTPGKKEVTVSWGNDSSVSAKFNIYVAAKVDVSGDVNIKVDGSIADDQIGTAVSGTYQFKTIQQSLEFLGALDLDENAKKVINLAEGTYFEKVEVNIPNVSIIGSSDATKTVIEWDALFGELDESGFTHTTDSTATLNVRHDAVGFTIEGVTISNSWNNTAYFDEHKGTGYGEHRALAMLIQADKVVIDNCRLLGYQDTIEFFTGRQYVLNTYIQGRTDFIFGTNNTTYFYNCEICSIESEGYITAFKGNNKDGNDAVQYGAIFDHCNFTATANVEAGTTSIGRPWGAYAAVAVINSELGGHISKLASTGASKGQRYVTMSNNNPYDANVKFVEYNNTGDGAITEEVRGMRMLTASEAENYSNLSVIFGTTNGGVTYTSAWDGGKGTTITEKTLKFSDYYVSGDEYNNSHAAENEAFFGDYATVTGTWNHELNQSKDQAKFMADTVIKFNVQGEVTVVTYGGAYGLPENVKISYKDGCATLTIVATENSPIANGCYITAITINMAVIPEDGDVEEPAPEEIVYDTTTSIAIGSYTGSTFEGTKGEYLGVLIDATSGKFAANGGNVQVNNGTVLKVPVVEGATVTVTEYPGYDGQLEISEYEDGYITITVNANTYFISIEVTY